MSLLEIQSDKQKKTALGIKKGSQIADLADEVETVRTSIVFTADQHRRYKIYLATQGKKMKDDLMKYVESCIKDIK